MYLYRNYESYKINSHDSTVQPTLETQNPYSPDLEPSFLLPVPTPNSLEVFFFSFTVFLCNFATHCESPDSKVFSFVFLLFKNQSHNICILLQLVILWFNCIDSSGCSSLTFVFHFINIPWICLSVLLLLDIWNIFSCFLLQTMVHWTSPGPQMQRFLSLSIYLGVKLYIQPKKIMPNCFPDWLTPVCSS